MYSRNLDASKTDSTELGRHTDIPNTTDSTEYVHELIAEVRTLQESQEKYKKNINENISECERRILKRDSDIDLYYEDLIEDPFSYRYLEEHNLIDNVRSLINRYRNTIRTETASAVREIKETMEACMQNDNFLRFSADRIFLHDHLKMMYSVINDFLQKTNEIVEELDRYYDLIDAE